MTFADGWVCRACWKPNRARDNRCYRCKTERDADTATVEERRREQRVQEKRRERVPVAVLALPSKVFAWYGRIMIIGAFFLLLLTPLVLSYPNSPPNTLLIWLGYCAVAFVIALAMRWASIAMHSSNPWAFVVALLVSLGAIGTNLYAMSVLPPNIGAPNLLRVFYIAVFGFAGVLAFVGLVFALRSVDEANLERSPSKGSPTTGRVE